MKDGFYDPFETDEIGDRMDFKKALTRVNNEVDTLNFDMENNMSDTKPAVKKTVTKKEDAPAVKKTVTKAPEAKAEPTKKAEPAKKEAKATGPRGLSIPEGFTGLDTIAKTVGSTPTVLRRKLRGLEGVEKPASGVWAWKNESKELARIVKLLSPKAA